MSERILLFEVFTISRRILCHQNQFFHAFFRQLMSFRDDRSESTAAKVSAHLRNETEGTRTIAALGNFDKGIMGRRGEDARRRFIVEISRALIAERHDR